MSQKRRDNKNRILQTGESQRTDGRYAYKYTDLTGNVKFVYAWKLVPTDKTPKGKRDDLSLREKEKEIQRDIEDGIDTVSKKMTLCDLYKKYTESNRNVRQITSERREYFLSKLKKDIIGSRSIDSIKMSDAKEWVIRMKENGYSFNTIKNDKRSLYATFNMAIQDDYVRKNPFDFKIQDVIEDDRERKQALTDEQVKELFDFIVNDRTFKKRYDEFVILLGTGLRASELCGITAKDLDFENGIINVDHQLIKSSKAGFYISPPKTKNGYRQIPMTKAVSEAFKRSLEKSEQYKNISVGECSHFIFFNRNGKPRYGEEYSHLFVRLCRKYKKKVSDNIPDITPHIMRHTFCTNLANAGMNPKALQYIMGHSTIAMTLDYYAHATYATAKEEMERLSVA